ncbi:hypothetical protein BDR26DRAFT_898243 [Obelidium mucronatum]|nr:hypothetical protein BDR26DRAFT_898243 [Obelidium mucronatum]
MTENRFYGSGGDSVSLSGKLGSGKAAAAPANIVDVTSPQSDLESDFHGGGGGCLRMSNLTFKACPAPGPPQPSPNVAAQGSKDDRTIHGDAGGSLNLSAAMGSSKAPPTYATEAVSPGSVQVHGDGIGSLKLSESLGTNKPPPTYAKEAVVHDVRGDAGGSLKLSEALGTGKAPPTYAAEAASPASVQPHGGGGGSLKLSEAISSASNTTENTSNSLSRKKSLLKNLKEDTPMDDLLKILAGENGWTAEELAEDTAKFKKYRIKTVKQARDLTMKAWDEMTDLLPITKDLVRAVIGWEA